MVFLRAGRHVIQLSYEDFERWVREGRVHDRVEVHFPPVTGDQWVRAGELEMYRSLLDDERARFQRQFTLQRFPYVTAIFVFSCVAYWGITAIEMIQRGAAFDQLLQTPRFDLLVDMGAKEGAHMIELGQWWRLLSFSFLHAGLIHLVPNMLYTAYVGWSVEAVYGRSSAVVIFLFSALGCGLASVAVSTVPSVGASGITFGLFAAAVVFGWKFEPLIPPGYTKKFGWAFFPFLVVFLVIGFTSPLVDNWGHVGGVIGGGAAAFALAPDVILDKANRRSAARWRSYVVALTMFATVFGGPLLIGPRGALTVPRLNLAVIHDNSGLTFQLPTYWARPRVRDAFPYDAYTSPSKAMALSYGVAVQEYPVHPDEITGRFLDEVRGVPGYEAVYDTLREEELYIGDVEWRLITLTVEEGSNRRIYQRAATWRGCVEYRLTFQNLPESFDDYAGLRQRILDTAELAYPRAIREGEDQLKFNADVWKLHSDLGRAYAIYGDVEAAESELLRAREMAPEAEEPLFWLLFLYDRYHLKPQRRWSLVEEAFDRHGSNGDILLLGYEVCRTLENRGCMWRALSAASVAHPHHPKLDPYIEEFGGIEALAMVPGEPSTPGADDARALPDEGARGGDGALRPPVPLVVTPSLPVPEAPPTEGSRDPAVEPLDDATGLDPGTPPPG